MALTRRAWTVNVHTVQWTKIHRYFVFCQLNISCSTNYFCGCWGLFSLSICSYTPAEIITFRFGIFLFLSRSGRVVCNHCKKVLSLDPGSASFSMRLCVDDCVSSRSPKTCTVDLLEPPNCSEILMCECDDWAFIFLPPEIVIHPSYTELPAHRRAKIQKKQTSIKCNWIFLSTNGLLQ